MRVDWRRLFIGAIAVVTLGFTLAIALDLSPFLRGPEEWQWPYAPPGSLIRIGLFALVLTAYAFVFVPRYRYLVQPQNPIRFYLIGIWLAAPLIQIAYLSISDQPFEQLFARTVSAGASGVFSVGSTINQPADFLKQYPQIMPTLPVHPQRYPPGLALSFYYVRQFFEALPLISDPLANRLRLYQCVDINLMRLSNPTLAAAVWQMALPLLSSLVVFPLYGLANLVVNRATAVWAVLLYPLVPSFVLWTGVWDQFYPLLAVASWFLLARGLKRNQLWALLAGGLVLSAGSFFSFAVLSLLAPMGLWAVFELLRQKRSLWSAATLRRGALFFAGLTFPWIVYQLIFGHGWFDILAVSMGFHIGIRTYSTWLFYHLYDFGLFLGLPLTLLFLAAVATGVKEWGRQIEKWLLPLAFGAGLLLVNVSGLAQGEVARVWLFLTPFAVIAAGQFWVAKLSDRSLLGLITLMSVQLIVLGGVIRPVTTGAPDLPAYERQFTPSQPEIPIESDFAGLAGLIGADLPDNPVEAGQPFEVTLFWEARQPLHRPYTAFVHLVAADGTLLAQSDQMPVGNVWPTTCWRPGEFVTDIHTLTLPEELSAGFYELSSGLYWLETGERLAVKGPHARQDHVAYPTLLQVNAAPEEE